MNYKVFSEVFNLQLYYQVKNLVYRSLKMRAADTDNTLLGYNHPKQSLRTVAGDVADASIFQGYICVAISAAEFIMNLRYVRLL